MTEYIRRGIKIALSTGEDCYMNFLNLKTNDNFSTYWDEFYQGKSVGITPTSPSQFAAFCLSEMFERNISFVHEIGCGNGRDTLFFLRYGINVSAVDSSSSAIHATKLLCGGSKNFSYHRFDAIEYLNKIERKTSRNVAFYARFFLHALNENKTRLFLRSVSKSMVSGDVIFLEYRTKKDEKLTKITPKHYRNYLDPAIVINEFDECGMRMDFHAEALGFAKLRDDNAFTCRQIFIKT